MYIQQYQFLIKCLITELTNREELSFLRVLALPNASRTGLAWIT